MRGPFLERVRKLSRRWVYGAIAVVMAAGLVVGTPKASEAGILDLIFGGIQYLQLSNINDNQEVQLGRRTDQALKRQGVRVYTRNPEITNYVNRIGQRLAQRSRRKNIPYTFQVVQDDSVNAFATSGGFVYINTGLIRRAETEAELAGVMAHEIGHIVGRHSINRMREIALANGLAGALGVSQDALVNIGVQLALSLPNSRSAEYEADELGFENMGRAGYDQRGFISFMRKLGEGRGAAPEFLSTHPDPGNRVSRLEGMYQDSGRRNATDGSDPQAYRNSIRGL